MIKYAIITCIFILFDIITGFIKAWSQKNIDSVVLRQGLMHKLSEIVAIAFGFLCEYATSYIDIGVSLPLSGGICTYIIIMEIISILENIIIINPELKRLFGKYLDKLKDTETEGDEKNK